MPLIQGHAKSADVAGGFYDTEISQSLRFNDDDGAYLSWTPASAGNRKTWTWSGWVKRGNLGYKTIFGTGDSPIGSTNNNLTQLYFQTDDTLKLLFYTSATTYTNLATSQVFRDPSAWYHVVLSVDTTQATSSDRIKIYINGSQITAFSTSTYPSQNFDCYVNGTNLHVIGEYTGTGGGTGTYAWDGYQAEMHLIDGTALDATSFGEFKSGVWIPKAYEGSYGTNGFYLPFNHDYSVEGFSATTWKGNGVANTYMGGVGFSPDLIWIKQRSGGNVHYLTDSVRGALKGLSSNLTDAEYTYDSVRSFENDGFTMGTSATTNSSGGQYVAWCWDAGTGSPVSNEDGSITSTVKASTDYGFSIVSWEPEATAGTVGHGLTQKPEFIIMKDRDANILWLVYHEAAGTQGYLSLNTTDGFSSNSTTFTTAPTNDVFDPGSGVVTGNSYTNMIAYCFHSVSGYSKIGSYTGTGASGNKITTGFKPAFVMIKDSTNSGSSWVILDSTRDTTDPRESGLYPDDSYAEIDVSPYGYISSFDSDGFTVAGSGGAINLSGATMIYMAFADKREAAFWLDQSGNNNDWENNNLTESDISLDSPTNNFATLNPLTLTVGDSSNGTLSEGNLQWIGTFNNDNLFATMAVPSGKWYYEIEIVATPNNLVAGWSTTDESTNSTEAALVYYNSAAIRNGTKTVVWNTDVTTGLTFSVGNIIGFALDVDGGDLKVYQNNSLVSTITLPTDKGDTWIPALGDSSSTDASVRANFGQDSSFAGNKTAQGNTDDNGYGDFYYAPPSGYLALCTANLPDPVASIDPAQDGSPQDHFNTVLYTGDGTTPQAITGVGFQPDLVWIKRRDSATDNTVLDSIRGDARLETNNTDAELGGNVNIFGSFDSDGFTTGYSSQVGASGGTYVAWNWKANGSGVSNTDGSITSTVSANTDAGFSIVSYTGNATSGATVGHGLSSAPEMIIVFNRDNGATSHSTYHVGIAATHVLRLNTTAASSNDATHWNDTEPTSSVFTVGNSTSVNGSGNDLIAYCFHSVDNFSKFGSYTGNGSTDGPFVYTGFRPAFVMIKNTQNGTNSWVIADSKRNTFNEVDLWLQPNGSYAESNLGTTYDIDFLSNGFKIRDATNFLNQSTYKLIYMAFAENPFKYANAR
jgi:hypothetical protein